MIDILGTVYDYVREYAWRNNDCPKLRPEQIIRGWQNTGTLPQDTTEFCVLTLRLSTTHGKAVNLPLVDDYEYHAQYFKTVEHVVQIDFCSAEPYVLPQQTKLRADLIDTLSFSPEGPAFFQRIDKHLNCLYSEGVTDLSYFDQDKLYTARYMVTVHLSEIQPTNFLYKQSFNVARVQMVNAIERASKTTKQRG